MKDLGVDIIGGEPVSQVLYSERFTRIIFNRDSLVSGTDPILRAVRKSFENGLDAQMKVKDILDVSNRIIQYQVDVDTEDMKEFIDSISEYKAKNIFKNLGN